MSGIEKVNLAEVVRHAHEGVPSTVGGSADASPQPLLTDFNPGVSETEGRLLDRLGEGIWQSDKRLCPGPAHALAEALADTELDAPNLARLAAHPSASCVGQSYSAIAPVLNKVRNHNG
ncbi:MAG: hypothetical protein AAGD86_14825, partial [Pseudomonadota bacterium]